MCGEIGLAPSEFWALQYSELELLIQGHREKQRSAIRQRQELAAWMLQWLMLPHMKKDADPLSIDQLLGRKPRRKPARRFASPGAAAEAFFAARSKQEQKRNG